MSSSVIVLAGFSETLVISPKFFITTFRTTTPVIPSFVIGLFQFLSIYLFSALPFVETSI